MFTVTFKTTNAAFSEDPFWELKAIMGHIVDQLEDEVHGGLVFDSNGNQIGTWGFEEEK